MWGLISFVQMVHYPLLDLIGYENFMRYEANHVQLTTMLVALPMLIEAVTAGWLLWQKVPRISVKILWVNAILLAIIWASSFCLQVPMHSTLLHGFDQSCYEYLVRTNWIRTALWGVRSLLLFSMLYQLLNKQKNMRSC